MEWDGINGRKCSGALFTRSVTDPAPQYSMTSCEQSRANGIRFANAVFTSEYCSYVYDYEYGTSIFGFACLKILHCTFIELIFGETEVRISSTQLHCTYLYIL